MDNLNTLSNFLQSNNLSICEVCKLTGESRATVYRRLNGSTPVPIHFARLLYLYVSATPEHRQAVLQFSLT